MRDIFSTAEWGVGGARGIRGGGGGQRIIRRARRRWGGAGRAGQASERHPKRAHARVCSLPAEHPPNLPPTRLPTHPPARPPTHPPTSLDGHHVLQPAPATADARVARAGGAQGLILWRPQRPHHLQWLGGRAGGWAGVKEEGGGSCPRPVSPPPKHTQANTPRPPPVATSTQRAIPPGLRWF